jgi:hypothetical protein
MNNSGATLITHKNYFRPLLSAAALFLAISAQCLPGQEVAKHALNARVPVILELFTSEGCSSCPPADGLLAKLDEQQPIPGAEIIALEEHVDYWDHQGWVDPFSSAQWTQRQQTYAAALSDHGVYTPELVINGKTAFVGSREGEAYRAIANAASQARADISISLLNSEKRGHERVKIEVGKLQDVVAGETVEVWIAVAEKALHSAVGAGENAGQDLHHAPVVRWFHKLGTADSTKAPAFSVESDLKLDSAWKRNNLRVIGIVQEKRSRRIIGATSARIEP